MAVPIRQYPSSKITLRRKSFRSLNYITTGAPRTNPIDAIVYIREENSGLNPYVEETIGFKIVD